eukprot:5269285-Prymnesium_polylepis.1
MSNEKARRAIKQQLRSDLDDEASSGADVHVGGNAAVAGGRGGARGRGHEEQAGGVAAVAGGATKVAVVPASRALALAHLAKAGT